MQEEDAPRLTETFYARFNVSESVLWSTLPHDDRPLSLSTVGMRKKQLRVNVSKAAGPDNMQLITNKTYIKKTKPKIQNMRQPGIMSAMTFS